MVSATATLTPMSSVGTVGDEAPHLAALQSQWQRAGMRVTIHALSLEGQIQAFQAKAWQAALAARTAHGPGMDSAVPVPSVVIGPYWDQAWGGKG